MIEILNQCVLAIELTFLCSNVMVKACALSLGDGASLPPPDLVNPVELSLATYGWRLCNPTALSKVVRTEVRTLTASCRSPTSHYYRWSRVVMREPDRR